MSQKKIKLDELKLYESIKLYQPLLHGEIILTYAKVAEDRWFADYSTTSAFHICPYDGAFRKCEECGALEEDFDVGFCISKRQLVTTKELCNIVNRCYQSDIKVDLIEDVFEGSNR